MEQRLDERIFPRKAILILLSSFLLLAVSQLLGIMGVMLNKFVVHANGGQMPFSYAESDRLGTIILFPRSSPCKLLSGEKNPPGIHKEFTSEKNPSGIYKEPLATIKFPLLGDRFYLRILNECEARSLPAFAETEFRQLRLVSEGGWGMASVGDFLQWGGVLIRYASFLGVILAVGIVFLAMWKHRHASS